MDEEHLAQIVKYVETELTNEIKTRFQAFLAIRQTSIWKVCESIIDQHVGIWLHEVKKKQKPCTMNGRSSVACSRIVVLKR
ncbi:hypothetical protein JS44_05020 [Anoxybacillus flavithermus]|uniref:Uncharacterized protein n=1 Tax=Anoxybacillus flavithermus TaxID=33934 RepID=A0A094JIU6_9BACL|nr:hypothetical protein JS44_05020 [Anoxybacillus flavithermus]